MADGRPVKIYLPSLLVTVASRAASRNPRDQSLSAMIRRLLDREIKRAEKKKGTA